MKQKTMATKREVINGITVILPRDAKLTKDELFSRYGTGTSFNHTREFTDQLSGKIKAKELERKANSSINNATESADAAKEVSQQDAAPQKKAKKD